MFQKDCRVQKGGKGGRGAGGEGKTRGREMGTPLDPKYIITIYLP